MSSSGQNHRVRSGWPLVTWAIAGGFVAIFILFVFVVDAAGLLAADWGWIVGGGGAAFFTADFLLVRYILERALRVKSLDREP